MREKLFYFGGLIIRLGLGFLFLWSSLPKIRHPYDFLSAIYNFELVGPKMGMLIAMVLPWLELLVAVCLIGGIFISGALLVCIGMSAMFTFVIISALYRGLGISCGCFGTSNEVINYYTMIRACMILFFSIGAYILALHSVKKSIYSAYQSALIRRRLWR